MNGDSTGITDDRRVALLAITTDMGLCLVLKRALLRRLFVVVD